jgi:hypothetical protein
MSYSQEVTEGVNIIFKLLNSCWMDVSTGHLLVFSRWMNSPRNRIVWGGEVFHSMKTTFLSKMYSITILSL